MGLANRAGICALAVMAKAPRSGEVKTRLVPPLRAEEAAILSGCFLQDITENFIAASRLVPVQGYVAYSPPGSEALFRDLVLPEILLLPPHRVGLGYSLLRAAEDLLQAGYGSACLFDDIAWSTELVFQQTVERAASLALDVVTLPTWYDVDDAASLRWLCEEVAAGRSAAEFIAAGYPAPHTADYLRGLVALRGADTLGIDGLAGE